MNKNDLIRIIAKDTKDKAHKYQRIRKGVSQGNVRLIVNKLFYEINKALLNKKKVIISDFGTFSVYKSNRTVGYDYQAKRVMQVPRVWRIKFKPGRHIKKMIKDS